MYNKYQNKNILFNIFFYKTKYYFIINLIIINYTYCK